jgi:hypothetical protein
MPSILGANTLSSGGYTVDNSCRFDNNAYMQSANTNSTNNPWTFSVWIKRAKIGAEQTLIMSYTDSNDFGLIRFGSDDTLLIGDYVNGSYVMKYETNRKFRDVSAWYHIVVSQSAVSGASPATLLYVNGVQETSFGTSNAYSQNDTQNWQKDGENFNFMMGQGEHYQQAYVCEAVWIDNTVYAASDFGEFDEDSGIWKPKDPSGLNFGTNGFYFDFADSGNLGDNEAGNSRADFSENNIAATDQSTDTCTNNFATWNPLRKHLAFTATFSEGNTIVEHGQADQNQTAFSTMAVSTGKWYAEFQCSTNASNFAFGIARINTTNSGGLDSYPGSLGGMHYAKNGEIQWYAGGDANSDTGTTFAHTDIIGVLFDLDNTRLYFYKNDTLVNSGGIDYSVGTAVDGSTSETTYYFAAGSSDGGTNPVLQANFGGSSGFAISSGNADPDGYGNFEFATKGGYALCTKNLAEYG